jgi:hypothetical protein
MAYTWFGLKIQIITDTIQVNFKNRLMCLLISKQFLQTEKTALLYQNGFIHKNSAYQN